MNEMEEYILAKFGNKIIIQKSQYIEDGWFIEINGREITLFEIPLYGGAEHKIKDFLTISEAIDCANQKLT